MPVLIAIAGGLRRGEILTLRGQDIDLESGSAIITRSLKQTTEGLRLTQPETERGRRTVVFPRYTLDALRIHRKEQATRWLALGPA